MNIALDAGVRLQAIRAANPDLNPARLKVGQIVVIPPPPAETAGTNDPAAPH